MAMRLHGMADALKMQQQDPTAGELSFLDRLAMLIDQRVVTAAPESGPGTTPSAPLKLRGKRLYRGGRLPRVARLGQKR